jgi:small acid-soluble spore protein N (minor)
MSKKNAVRRNSNHFAPNHIGTKPRGFGGNKGKQMQDQSGEHPDVIQTKGE